MARIVNEKRFGEATCTCYEIDPSKEPTPENLLCYKTGGIGVLSNKQDRECMDMIILPTPPSLEFHMKKFEIAGKEIIAECMKHDNEADFRACMQKQAEKHGMTYVTKKEKQPEPVEKPKRKEIKEPEKIEKPKLKKTMFDKKGKLIIPSLSKEIKQGTTIKATGTFEVEPSHPALTHPVKYKRTKVEPPSKPVKGTLDERLKKNTGRLSINEFVKKNPDIKKADVEKTVTGYIATGTATAIDDDVVYIH